jgi:hypothetical protein
MPLAARKCWDTEEPWLRAKADINEESPTSNLASTAAPGQIQTPPSATPDPRPVLVDASGKGRNGVAEISRRELGLKTQNTYLLISINSLKSPERRGANPCYPDKTPLGFRHPRSPQRVLSNAYAFAIPPRTCLGISQVALPTLSEAAILCSSLRVGITTQI